jgi:hypothetical protein
MVFKHPQKSGWYKAWENSFYEIQGRGSPGHKEYRIKDKNTLNFITEERCSNYRFCVEMYEDLIKDFKESSNHGKNT